MATKTKTDGTTMTHAELMEKEAGYPTLTEADAEKLERLGFHREQAAPMVRVGIGRSWVAREESHYWSTINAALIGILTEMAVRKGIAVHFDRWLQIPEVPLPQSRVIRRGNFVVRVEIESSASPRQKFNALTEILTDES